MSEPTVHEQIVAAVEAYVAESTRFEEKGVAASCARARAQLGDIAKLAKVRRAELQATKLARKAAKK